MSIWTWQDAKNYTDKALGKNYYSDIVFDRTSIAFDSNGNQIKNGVPVFEDFRHKGTQGIRVAPNITNLFSETNSTTFTNSEDVSLTDGTYTVSVKKGTGKIDLSGAITTTVAAGKYEIFDLPSDGIVTFTPSETPELCQLEKNPFPTPWHKGGFNRHGDSPRILLEGKPINEFGIGLLYRPYADSILPYLYNENWILYGYKDDDNYVRIVYRTDDQRFFVSYIYEGVSYSFYMDTAYETYPYKANELLGLYLHVVPAEGIYLYHYQNGKIRIDHRQNKNLPALGTLHHVSIGHRLKTSTGSFFTAGLFNNIRIELGQDKKPDPQKYFEEVL